MTNEKLKNICFNCKIWYETKDGERLFGAGKYELLKAIEETSSLKMAMEKVGWTYRKTWDNLQKIEETCGFPIIETHRGGIDKGSTSLTEEGKLLLRAYKELETEFKMQFKKMSKQILNKYFDEHY